MKKQDWFPVNQPLVLYCDSRPAISLAKDLKYSEKTKHIAMKLQSIWESVGDGNLILNHVRTELQRIDFLTKSLNKVKHLQCCNNVGLRRV
ncbi:hypothetical protein KP509_15G026100 [Ceratopteris richardii]|uniref:Uncharacterized protein n=1 Tax=Ceratopteris richardii TaxID=49495 RepID=A0A8T2T5H8_CERRI|nr:hypothetical protein KP509_15G026100 [Ceratopteris richardii]